MISLISVLKDTKHAPANSTGMADRVKTCYDEPLKLGNTDESS